MFFFPFFFSYNFCRGKLFVYTGVLPITQNKDELAVILGHEIAHAVAHHSAERLSSWWIVLVAGVTALVGLFDDGSGGGGRITSFFMDFLYRLPNSRTMEVCLYTRCHVCFLIIG